MKNKTIYKSLQEYFKNTPKEKIIEDWNEFQHLDNEGITVKEFLENQKQETIKQVAERIVLETYNETFSKFPIGGKISNETLIDALVLFFMLGSEWQQEQNKNLYSEEEVHKILGSYSAHKEIFSHKYTYNMWFEKFKKK